MFCMPQLDSDIILESLASLVHWKHGFVLVPVLLVSLVRWKARIWTGTSAAGFHWKAWIWTGTLLEHKN